MAFDTPEVLAQTECGDELAPGTSLFHGAYRITRFINSGGFGITYLAKDSLDRDVVIKECFSSTFCRRTQSRVRARSVSTQEHMRRIVKSFLYEARSLARLKHPGIVGVHQVFEDNDTAYMVLDYIRGHDLLEIIEDRKVQLTPDQIAAIAAKLVAAIGHVHRNGLLHCDISPDNIFLSTEGEPILIDFGAVRHSALGETAKYSGLSVVKDGYSPHELYAQGGASGPFSDLYALAASLYHLITGEAPPNSQLRLSAMAMKERDPCTPLAGRWPGFPAGFLESIDRAMAVRPAMRFQSADDWLKLIAPHAERRDKKVVLLRRIVPGPAQRPAEAAPAPAPAPAPVAANPQPVRPRRPLHRAASVDLSPLARINGFVGGWLIDGETGEVLAGQGAEPGTAAAMSAHVRMARVSFPADDRQASGDEVEDVVISLGRRLHLFRPVQSAPSVFLCVALEKEAATPTLARIQMKRIAQSVQV